MEISSTLAIAILIILVALVFDFINGFHDAANSIATVVSTRVLSPMQAVGWAAFFNFIAYLIFPLAVAKTIGKGVVDPHVVTLAIITAGLVGAIVWDLITWWLGIPTSSSHALVGGFAGAALMAAGPHALQSAAILKIGAFIIIAPVAGMVIGYGFMVATYWICRHWTPAKVTKRFRRLQMLSAAAYSLGHGGNDAQKTMGIIFAILLAADPETQTWFGLAEGAKEPPMWVVYACHAAMGLGTLMGGWRIVKTMGQKICKLQPVHGFSAETAGAVMLYGATLSGIPVSTTHTITGAIVGVGATRGFHAVKWGVATRVVWAWVLTIPAAALVAAACWAVFSVLGWR